MFRCFWVLGVTLPTVAHKSIKETIRADGAMWQCYRASNEKIHEDHE